MCTKSFISRPTAFLPNTLVSTFPTLCQIRWSVTLHLPTQRVLHIFTIISPGWLTMHINYSGVTGKPTLKYFVNQYALCSCSFQQEHSFSQPSGRDWPYHNVKNVPFTHWFFLFFCGHYPIKTSSWAPALPPVIVTVTILYKVLASFTCQISTLDFLCHSFY